MIVKDIRIDVNESMLWEYKKDEKYKSSKIRVYDGDYDNERIRES